ncbi:hypothetical protein HY640_00335 [Candidatus Woesearchaeota archaeon]|nr:hypothetical protein [Candidatus Woesearchaeota archaeon]
MRNALFMVFLVSIAAMAALTATGAVDTSFCEHDCTFTFDELCHSECHGVNGCVFVKRASGGGPPPPQPPFGDASASCNGTYKGFSRVWKSGNPTLMVRCCEGNYTGFYSIPAIARINGTNVVRVTKLVWLDGKPTKMIINVFSLK